MSNVSRRLAASSLLAVATIAGLAALAHLTGAIVAAHGG